MKIDCVKIYGVVLPFGGPFEHAKRKGAFAKNVVVEVIAEKGNLRGYGEGAPREFVTGETQKNAIQAIQIMVEGESPMAPECTKFYPRHTRRWPQRSGNNS